VSRPDTVLGISVSWREDALRRWTAWGVGGERDDVTVFVYPVDDDPSLRWQISLARNDGARCTRAILGAGASVEDAAAEVLRHLADARRLADEMAILGRTEAA
jgi:hypothetical protein